MHEPFIFLFVSDGALHVGKKLPTEPDPRELFDVRIEDVVTDAFDEASRKLGATALGILKLWHKDLFRDWGDSVDGLNASTDEFEVALALIDRLSAGGSEDRLKLIDEILSDAAASDEAASKYLKEDWPPLRKRLLRE